MSVPCVHLEGVDFRYRDGDFRLSVPELLIERGERVACIGPSGAGKTTLVNIMAGVIAADRGRVAIEGSDLAELSENQRRALRVRRIGMVFQEFELLDYLTAIDNILLPHRVSSALRLDAEARERARGLARSVGVAECLDRRPRRLSQGQRQRVALCRALVTQPALVLCDEPTGNLDEESAGQVMDLVFEQAGAQDAAVLVVTHDRSILDRFPRVIDVREFAAGAAS